MAIGGVSTTERNLESELFVLGYLGVHTRVDNLTDEFGVAETVVAASAAIRDGFDLPFELGQLFGEASTVTGIVVSLVFPRRLQFRPPR